jgi:uroporphyrinogen-III synthase
VTSSKTKPLAGWRVLVPRGGRWGDTVAATLRGYGAVPVIAPLINFASTDDAQALANAFYELQDGQFDWLVVTSATTVDVLAGQSVTVPPTTKIAAVGETTAAALAVAGYTVEFIPEGDNSARGLLKEWPTTPITGRVLVPQSDIAEPTLVSGLADLGLDVQFVSAYRTVGVPIAEHVAADGAVGCVARQVATQLSPLPAGTIVACIGPRTAFDARAAGLTVDVIAESRSADALVDALVEHVTNSIEKTPEDAR